MRYGGGAKAGKIKDESGNDIYIHRAFDRNAKVIYHEFGHGILARQGQAYAPLGSFTFTHASYHEGGSDFIATSVYIATIAGGVASGNRNILDWLIDTSNSKWRTCENLPFSDSGYYTEWLNTIEQHINGQALCQAMAMYQDRARSVFNRSLNYTLSEFILASGLFTFEDTALTMAKAIPALTAVEIIRAPFYGGISLDQEIKAAFAAHGMIYNSDHLDAIVIDNNGEGHRYSQPDQSASYNVYSGKNNYFVIEFSKDSSFSNVCYSKFGSTDYIKHPNHRYWSGTISANDISTACWGSWNYYWSTIYYRVKTCDNPVSNKCIDSDSSTRTSNRSQSALIGTNQPPTPGERCYSSGPFTICCNSNPFIEVSSPGIFFLQLFIIIAFIFIMKRKSFKIKP